MQLLGVLLALLISQASGGASDLNAIVIRLSLDKQQHALGEKIQVAVQVENEGDRPIIVSNIISDSDNPEGYVEFDLTDSTGLRQTPQVRSIADAFDPFPRDPDWRLLLGRWTVLYPKDSMTCHLILDGVTFPFLTKPGRYKLAATYSSAGLTYPMNYRSVGLKEQDVRSLRFPSWSGKVRSDSVWMTIVSAKITKQK